MKCVCMCVFNLIEVAERKKNVCRKAKKNISKRAKYHYLPLAGTSSSAYRLETKEARSKYRCALSSR
jgi:hypothetical protein